VYLLTATLVFFNDPDFLITVIRNHTNSRSLVKQCGRTEAKAVQ